MQIFKNTILLFLFFSFLINGLPNTLSAFAQTPVLRNFSVSAIVPPKNSDFEFNFVSAPTNVSQNTTLGYEIKYGAKASGGLTTTTTLTADWSADTAPDGSHVLEYVAGSAGTAYDNTVPIVDLINKRITWTIQALPAGVTGQVVSFQLKTTDNYTGLSAVNFTVRSTMTNDYIDLPALSITRQYKFVTSVPGPTAIPTPTIQQVPTPAIRQTSLRITDVSFKSISQSTSGIAVTTTIPAKLSISYGTSPTSLIKNITTTHYARNNNITLENLSPNTTYYLRITATGINGQKATSEIFTFQTSQTSELPDLRKNVVAIVSNGTVLALDVVEKDNYPLALVTNNTPYEVTYRLKQKINLKSIEVVIRNKNVLGTNSETTEPQESLVPMIIKEPNLYSASIKNTDSGAYEIYVRIRDSKGNLVEEKIADIKIIPRLSVYEKDTDHPIADARISIQYYNTKAKIYKPVSPDLFKSVKNPVYTNTQGEADLVLPKGKYRAVASAFGYDQYITDFVLGANHGEEFPQIYLEKNPGNLMSMVIYCRDLFTDFMNNVFTYMQSLSLSTRYFDFLGIFVMTAFVILTFILFSIKTHISFHHIPAYVSHHLHGLFKKRLLNSLHGSIVDSNNTPVKQARIEIIDSSSRTVLAHTGTNKNGRFYIRNLQVTNPKLIVTKEGYIPSSLQLNEDTDISAEGLQVVLQHEATQLVSPAILILPVLDGFLALCFEFFLVCSLLLEVFFFFVFGFTKTIPFFILSFFNMLLWVFYLREKRLRT